MARLRELITENVSRAQKAAMAQKTVDRIDEQLGRERAVLSELTPAPVWAPLIAPLESARALGNLGERKHSAERRLDELRRRAATRLAALPNWSHTLQALAEMPFPSVATINRHRKEMDAQRARERALCEKISGADAEVAEIDNGIAGIEAGGAVATLDAVREARQRRDEFWRRIRSVFIDDSPGDAPFVPEDYERAVAAADELSDRRVADAERAAQHAALVQRRDAVAKFRTETVDALALAKDERATAEIAWQELWRTVGIAPLQPDEMLAWMDQRRELLEIHDGISGCECDIRSLERAESLAKETLSRALTEIDETSPDGSESMEVWIAECTRILEGRREIAQDWKALNERVRELDEGLADARRERDVAEKDLSAWRDAWRNALSCIQQDPDITPQEVTEILDLASEIADLLRQSDDLEQRIDGMRRDIDEFANNILQVASNCGVECHDGDSVSAARELHTQLQRAKRNRERNEDPQNNLTKVKKQQWQAEAEVADAKSILAGLCRSAGCTDIAALPAIEEKAIRKRNLAADMKKREGELVEHGGGRALGQILDDVLAEDADSLPARIEVAHRKMGDTDGEIHDVSVRLGERKNELASMDGGDAAADAQQRAEELLASIRTAARQYVRLKLSREVLRRAIESYREKNQAPLLRSASGFFEKLTLGNYAALKTIDSARGRPQLVGLLSDGGEVAVPVMSDGARDQLYLSLRLAALDSYLEHNPPLPLIADDLFIHFDTDRAAAAFDILGELAAKTQTLFFTHHDHLARLAVETLGPERVERHDLGVRATD